MNKRDKEKLRNAFDIPNPERKAEFLASHGDKFIRRKKSDKKPALLRFAPAMALAVLFVCLLGAMKPEHDLRKKVGTDDLIIETTDTSTAATTTALVTSTEDPPVRTTTTARSSGTVSVSSIITAAVSTKPDVTVASAVTTITKTDEPTEFTENTSPAASTARPTATTTRKSTSKSTAKTTAKSTSKTAATTLSTSRKTTSSTTDIQVTTSENDGMVSVITTTEPTSVSDDNVDYSVVPEIIYTPTDNIYETDTSKLSGGNPTCGYPACASAPDLVIRGTIVDMIFTKMNSQPYTQFNVEIDRFIMGDEKFKTGDTISFYVRGGCMPAKEFFELFPNEPTYDLEITDDLTVFDIGELSEKYYPGKQTTFYLDKSSSDFPENTFMIHK